MKFHGSKAQTSHSAKTCKPAWRAGRDLHPAARGRTPRVKMSHHRQRVDERPELAERSALVLPTHFAHGQIDEKLTRIAELSERGHGVWSHPQRPVSMVLELSWPSSASLVALSLSAARKPRTTSSARPGSRARLAQRGSHRGGDHPDRQCAALRRRRRGRRWRHGPQLGVFGGQSLDLGLELGDGGLEFANRGSRSRIVRRCSSSRPWSSCTAWSASSATARTTNW